MDNENEATASATPDPESKEARRAAKRAARDEGGKGLRLAQVQAKYERTKTMDSPKRMEAAQQKLQIQVLEAIADGTVRKPHMYAAAVLGRELPERELSPEREARRAARLAERGEQRDGGEEGGERSERGEGRATRDRSPEAMRARAERRAERHAKATEGSGDS